MMKKGFSIGVLLLAGFVMTSCLSNVFDPDSLIKGKLGSKDVTISGVKLGYNENMSYGDKGFSLEDNQLVYFNSREQLEEMLVKYPDKNLDSSNVIQFNKSICPVKLKIIPEGAMVNGWKLTSSDTSIVKVTDYKSLGIDKTLGLDEAVLYMNGVGECSLTLTVSGKNDVEVSLPMKAVSVTTLKFKCTPYWLGNLVTRIHWRCKDVPSNVKDVVFKVADSVQVIGEVRYYDHRKYGSKEKVLRDTITYPNEVFYSRFKKSTFHMLRNVTSAVREFNSRKEEGTTLQWNNLTKTYDTVSVSYGWSAKMIDCVFNIVSDNPYLQFSYVVKPGKSYDEKDKDGNIVDAGADGEEKDEAEDDNLEDISSYFKLSLNDGLSPSQRDSIMRVVNQTKEQYGYDADNLTENEKNALIDKMNTEKEKF